jgi:uncharacterized GH25 family protein
MKSGTKTHALITLALLAGLLIPDLCLAHFPWLNAADLSPDTGERISMTVGYGHAYPLGGFLTKDKVESLVLSGPSPGSPGLAFTTDRDIASSENITTPGVYIVSAAKKPGFYTKTADGGKQVSKKGLKNVKKCSYSHSFMKAVITVGDGNGRVDTPVGQTLEIIPLKNPKDLHSGGTLPVRVLYRGNPRTGELMATCAGLSTEKDAWAQKTMTDRDGNASIALIRGGIWLLKSLQEEKYPDCTECDAETFGSTLTFEIK